MENDETTAMRGIAINFPIIRAIGVVETMEEPRVRRFQIFCGLALAIFAGLSVSDQLTTDEPFGLVEFILEDAPESLLMAIAIATATYAITLLRDTSIERNGLAKALHRATVVGDHWRAAARAHSEGLAEAIRCQFEEWRLTAGECDVATLMLKGLSHKEIAILRKSSSATVRQQAAAVYQKSGLGSRAELAAFFLEDLFPSVAKCHAAPLDEQSNISHTVDHVQVS